MVNPINYGAYFQGTETPAQAFESAFKSGYGMQEMMDKRAAAQAQAQALAEQKRIEQEAQAELLGLFDNPDATPRDYQRFAIKYPALQDRVKAPLQSMTEAEQKATLQTLSRVVPAFAAGKPEVALEVLREQAEGYRNAGDTKGAKILDDVIRATEINPAVGRSTAYRLLNAVPGGDKIIEGLAKEGQETRAQAMAPAELRKAEAQATGAEAEAVTKGVTAQNAPAMAAADLQKRTADAVKASAEAAVAPEMARLGVQRTKAEIGNISSQIGERAKRLALDEQKIALDIAEKLGTLPTNKLDNAAKKAIDDAVTNSTTQTQAARSMTNLAERIEQSGMGWGAFSWVAEQVKGATGTQGDISALRQEYARVRNSLAIKSLPPGPATDKDIELALRGFPGENADGKTIAQFLRGMAKMARIDSAVSGAKAEWVSSYGSVGAAKRSATIAGIDVTPGTKFEDFASRISTEVGASGLSSQSSGSRPPLSSFEKAQ